GRRGDRAGAGRAARGAPARRPARRRAGGRGRQRARRPARRRPRGASERQLRRRGLGRARRGARRRRGRTPGRMVAPPAAAGDARSGGHLPPPRLRRGAARMSVVALVRKELELYFTSFVFYGIATVFLVLAGYFFYTNLGWFVLMGGMNLTRGLWQYQFVDLQKLLSALVPLLTMRLFAEERKLGTLELLWTYPVRDAEIIAGQFVAWLLVVTAMLAATALHPILLSFYTSVAPGPLVAGYLGLWLLAAGFVACGVFLSALTDSQLVAAAATYGLLLFFWVITWNEAAVNEVTLR